MVPTVADLVGGGSGFSMGVLEPVERLRAGMVGDDYNPDAVSREDWKNAETITLMGYLASQSSIENPTEVRSLVDTVTQLIIPDPAADVERGDRIRARGHEWTVTGFPHADVNPFTGWRPTVVANLKEVLG